MFKKSLVKTRLIAGIRAALGHIHCVRGLVYRRWYSTLQQQISLSNGVKIGFGPVTTREDNLAERKWRIDPIVNQINATSDRFVAGIFFVPEEMYQFDIIVIVKKFNPSYFPVFKRLKDLGKLIIYDIVDNPNCGKPYAFYYMQHEAFLSAIDGFILSSPLHSLLLGRFRQPNRLIEHPIIHNIEKCVSNVDDTVKILAHGYYDNIKNVKYIEPLILSISKKINKKIVLYYHSEIVFPDTENVKYVKWTVENCFEIMHEVDIAISIKRLDLLHQKTKPSTKIINFMAAGLPVICFPTVADRMIINHGVNGFFAYHHDDWARIITELSQNAHRRNQIGRAARASVIHHYSVPAMTDRYVSLFEEVMNMDEKISYS